MKEQIDRKEKLTTTIRADLLYRAQALRFLLKSQGKKVNGVNKLVEEGLELVLDKYEEEEGISIQL